MHDEKLKIDFLGIGSAIFSDQNHISFIINDTLMFECPPGIPKQVRKAGRSLDKIKHIIISHLHGDHFFGLPFFLIEYLLNKRTNELLIYSNSEIESIIKDLIKLAYPEQSISEVYEYTQSKFILYNENSHFELEGQYSLYFKKVNHGNMLTHGALLSCNGLRLFYSADTDNFDGVNEIIALADILIIDATVYGFKIPFHFNFSDIYDFAEKNPQKLFFVTHRGIYKPDKTLPNLILPNDNNVFKIWKQGKILLFSLEST